LIRRVAPAAVFACLVAIFALGIFDSPITARAGAPDPDLQYFAGDDDADTSVSINGEDFQVNGQFTYPGRVWDSNDIEGLLLNSRMVNGVYDDMDGSPPSGMLPWDPLENTLDYIANMDDWRSQGLAALGINFQGGSNRCNDLFGDNQNAVVDNNPFGANGTKAFADWNNGIDSPESRYLARMGSIIRRADDLGMVVILGFFYFGQDDEIQDEAAVQAGVDAATDWVLENGWTNVLIEINNESNINYDHTNLQPDNVSDLIQRVQQRSSGAAGAHLPEGRLLVSTSGGGGYDPPDEWIQVSDFVLLHGNSLNSSGVHSLVDGVRGENVWQTNPKPIIFNEDSTSLSNFQAAVEEHASWGYYDNNGYQCQFDNNDSARWTLAKATEDGYWPMVAEISGFGVSTPTPTATSTGTPSPTPTASASPTGTPNTTPTSTPTPTQGPPQTQGDINCVNGVNQDDILLLIRYAAGIISGNTPGNCLDIGDPQSSGQFEWGDVNCNHVINAQDVLYLVAYRAGISLPVPGPCIPIGSGIT
jgi:hypothetical protein